MKNLMTVLALMVAACDVSVEVDAGKTICEILNPPGYALWLDPYAYGVPRVEGEPCNYDVPCYENLICVCGICLDTEDFNLE